MGPPKRSSLSGLLWFFPIHIGVSESLMWENRGHILKPTGSGEASQTQRLKVTTKGGLKVTRTKQFSAGSHILDQYLSLTKVSLYLNQAVCCLFACQDNSLFPYPAGTVSPQGRDQEPLTVAFLHTISLC